MASNFLTVADAAEQLGVSEEQIDTFAEEGKLRIVRSTPPLVYAIDVELLANPRPPGV